MAQQIEYEAMGLQLPTAYLMVGDVVLHAKDQTAQIFVYFYTTEEIRIAQTTPVMKIERVFVDKPGYLEFFANEKLSEAGMNPVKAAYELLKKYPEPVGMKELFDSGQEV